MKTTMKKALALLMAASLAFAGAEPMLAAAAPLATEEGAQVGNKKPTNSTIELSAKTAVVTVTPTAYYYDGQKKTPAVTVTVNGTALTEKKDFKVTYTNNVNIGTATITITGNGKYSGTITKTFTIGVKNGTVYTIGNMKYKIIGANQVAFAGVVNKQNALNVVVPATVTIGGKVFDVTSVTKRAMYKNPYVTTVELGAKVKVIGVSAFAYCPKLKTVKTGTGLTTISKYAFKADKNLTLLRVPSKNMVKVGKASLKGINKNAKIKVPRRKLAAYKTLFAKKGQPSGVKIVRL